MKRIVLMALAIIAAGATAAYAASPETVANAVSACCDGGDCC